LQFFDTGRDTPAVFCINTASDDRAKREQ